jgi:hypothetical protein
MNHKNFRYDDLIRSDYDTDNEKLVKLDKQKKNPELPPELVMCASSSMNLSNAWDWDKHKLPAQFVDAIETNPSASDLLDPSQLPKYKIEVDDDDEGDFASHFAGVTGVRSLKQSQSTPAPLTMIAPGSLTAKMTMAEIEANTHMHERNTSKRFPIKNLTKVPFKRLLDMRLEVGYETDNRVDAPPKVGFAKQLEYHNQMMLTRDPTTGDVPGGRPHTAPTGSGRKKGKADAPKEEMLGSSLAGGNLLGVTDDSMNIGETGIGFTKGLKQALKPYEGDIFGTRGAYIEGMVYRSRITPGSNQALLAATGGGGNKGKKAAAAIATETSSGALPAAKKEETAAKDMDDEEERPALGTDDEAAIEEARLRTEQGERKKERGRRQREEMRGEEEDEDEDSEGAQWEAERRCAATLRNWSFHEANARKMVAEGAVDALVTLAPTDDARTRASCATSFCNLSAIDSLRQSVIDGGGVESIVRLCLTSSTASSSSSNANVDDEGANANKKADAKVNKQADVAAEAGRSCALALCNLSCVQGAEGRLVDDGAVQALMAKMGESKFAVGICSRALFNLTCVASYYGERMKRVLKAFLTISSQVPPPSLETMQICASALCNLANIVPIRVHMVDEGVVGVLGMLARSSDDANTKRVCAIVLQSLASYDPCRADMVTKGAVPVLGALANTDDETRQHWCAVALHHLVQERTVRVQVVEEGGITSLATLSRSQRAATKRLCAQSLTVLSGYEKCKAMVVDKGAVPVLISLAKSDDSQTKQTCTLALCNLLSIQESAIEIMQQGAVSALVQLSNTDVEELRACCAAVLFNLSCTPPTAAMVVGEGFVQSILNLSKTHVVETQQRCAATLNNLASYEVNRTRMVEQMVVPCLVQLMVQGSAANEAALKTGAEGGGGLLVRYCTAALCSVSHSKENIGEIVKDPSYYGMMRELIRIASQLSLSEKPAAIPAGSNAYDAMIAANERQRGIIDTQKACCSVLSNLSFHEPSRASLAELGAIEALLLLSGLDDHTTRRRCALSLCNLSSEQSIRAKMVAKGSVKVLAALSNSYSEENQFDCAKAFCNLSCLDGSEGAIVADGAVAAVMMIAMVRAVKIQTKRTCARTLLNLLSADQRTRAFLPLGSFADNTSKKDGGDGKATDGSHGNGGVDTLVPMLQEGLVQACASLAKLKLKEEDEEDEEDLEDDSTALIAAPSAGQNAEVLAAQAAARRRAHEAAEARRKEERAKREAILEDTMSIVAKTYCLLSLTAEGRQATSEQNEVAKKGQAEEEGGGGGKRGVRPNAKALSALFSLMRAREPETLVTAGKAIYNLLLHPAPHAHCVTCGVTAQLSLLADNAAANLSTSMNSVLDALDDALPGGSLGKAEPVKGAAVSRRQAHEAELALQKHAASREAWVQCIRIVSDSLFILSANSRSRAAIVAASNTTGGVLMSIERLLRLEDPVASMSCVLTLVQLAHEPEYRTKLLPKAPGLLKALVALSKSSAGEDASRRGCARVLCYLALEPSNCALMVKEGCVAALDALCTMEEEVDQHAEAEAELEAADATNSGEAAPIPGEHPESSKRANTNRRGTFLVDPTSSTPSGTATAKAEDEEAVPAMGAAETHKLTRKTYALVSCALRCLSWAGSATDHKQPGAAPMVEVADDPMEQEAIEVAKEGAEKEHHAHLRTMVSEGAVPLLCRLTAKINGEGDSTGPLDQQTLLMNLDVSIAMCNLSREPSLREPLLERGGLTAIQKLVRATLGSAKGAAMAAAIEPVSEEQKQSVANQSFSAGEKKANERERVAALLDESARSIEAETHWRCSVALCHLSLMGRNRQPMVDEGVVTSLVGMASLGMGKSGVDDGNMANGQEVVYTPPASIAGGVVTTGLPKLAMTETMQACAAALFSLSRPAHCRARIVKDGAVPVLIALSKSPRLTGDAYTKKSCANAMSNLSSSAAEVEEGTISALIAMSLNKPKAPESVVVVAAPVDANDAMTAGHFQRPGAWAPWTSTSANAESRCMKIAANADASDRRDLDPPPQAIGELCQALTIVVMKEQAGPASHALPPPPPADDTTQTVPIPSLNGPSEGETEEGEAAPDGAAGAGAGAGAPGAKDAAPISSGAKPVLFFPKMQLVAETSTGKPMGEQPIVEQAEAAPDKKKAERRMSFTNDVPDSTFA